MTALSLLLATTTVTVAPGDDLQSAIQRAHGGRVVLRPGVYRVEKTIEIGPGDRGLTLVAQRPGTVRLSGGRTLASWKESGIPHVLVADVSGLSLGTMARRGFSLGVENAGMELFFQGRPMPLARYPNAGWLRTGATAGDRTFAVDDAHARRIAGDDVWALGYWNFDWAESYERAEIRDGALTLGEKPAFGLAAGRRYAVLNALSELDSPGEWYLDRKARRLYFWPPNEKGEAVVSVLEGPMIHLRDAEGVTVKGLVLEAGRGAAIRVEGGSKDLVQGCLIRNFGTEGVDMTDAKDSGVVGCDLTGLGSRAIHLGGGDRRTLAPGGLFAEDDRVWAWSRWERTYRPAVDVDGVGNRVRRCLFEDAPHNAVLLSGNDHLLEGNDVQRVCQETGDSGAFYMGRNPTMRGTVVRGNRFRDLGPRVTTGGNFTEVMSVYLDDGWPATLIEGNVFEGPGTGVMVGGGGDDRVLGNVFVGKSPAVHVDARGRGWAKDQILDPKQWDFPGKVREVDLGLYGRRYPDLAREIAAEFRAPLGTRVAGNVFVGGTGLRLQDGLAPADVGAADNAVLASGGLAEGLRRVPVDLTKIGLRTTRGRPSELVHG